MRGPVSALRVVRAAEADRAGAFDQPVDELVVDALLDQQPRAGRADLAGVQEHGRQGEVQGDLEVGVGEDDVGVLAAELERDLLDRGGGRGHHPPAGDQATGEGHQVDARVLDQGRGRVGTGAEDEVADARGQPGLLEQPHQDDAGVRRQLARLEHEGVAGGEAGRDLPGGLEERVVPRRDERTHADRLVDDAAEHVLAAGVDDPAGVLGGDVAVVPEHRDHVRDVVLALDQPLAGVHRLGQRHLVGVALEEVGQSEQQVAALAGGGRRPGTVVEGVVRRRDGGARVVGAGLVDLRHEGAVGGAADGAPAAGRRAHPSPVDVELRHRPVLSLSPAAPLPQLRNPQRIAHAATKSLSGE